MFKTYNNIHLWFHSLDWNVKMVMYRLMFRNITLGLEGFALSWLSLLTNQQFWNQHTMILLANHLLVTYMKIRSFWSTVLFSRNCSIIQVDHSVYYTDLLYIYVRKLPVDSIPITIQNISAILKTKKSFGYQNLPYLASFFSHKGTLKTVQLNYVWNAPLKHAQLKK